LIDCVTLWCTNFFYRDQQKAEQDPAWVNECLDDIKKEFDLFTAQDATFIFVTNEIGMGGVSANTLQRRFTDLQGWVNQYIASKAHEVTLMVSGIPVKIK
jgi:adenosylcobinamide kinase/adenosylcobinamide-phosphate guanylyltransferase